MNTSAVISSRIKIADVLSMARELARKLTQQEVLDDQLKNFYKIALLEVTALLNSAVESTYVEKASINGSISGKICTFELPIDCDRVLSVAVRISTKFYPVKLLKPDEYAAVKYSSVGTSIYANSVVGTQVGKTMELYIGENISVDEETLPVELYYFKQANIDVSDWNDDYVGLPDKYVPLLLKRIYSYILLQAQGDIPTNFANEMATDYRQIAEFLNADLLNKQVTRNDRK